MTRAVTCVDAKLQPADAGACKALAAPLVQRACNTAPCVGHSWQVKALQSPRNQLFRPMAACVWMHAVQDSPGSLDHDSLSGVMLTFLPSLSSPKG